MYQLINGIYVERINEKFDITANNSHIDGPISKLSVGYKNADLVVYDLLPDVPVEKQSDLYLKTNRADSLRVPASTLRAPGTKPALIDFGTSSESYFCFNYALRGRYTYEDAANVDIFNLKQRKTDQLNAILDLDREKRLANILTSATNMGSGAIFTNSTTLKWSDYANSDPIGDVVTARKFIHQQTIKKPNVMLISDPVYDVVIEHPDILDRLKTRKSKAELSDLAEIFRVDKVVVGDSLWETSEKGASVNSASYVWGDNVILAYIEPTPAMDTVSLIYNFRWSVPGIPNRQVRFFDYPDAGKVELQSHVYEDMKLIDKNCGYTMVNVI